MKITPCPRCNDAWIYVSEDHYTSGDAYRVQCKCGYIWKTQAAWFHSKDEAICDWNKITIISKENINDKG